jgi:coenzyme F420-reducing hydrogenase alpha subunit
MKNHLHVDLHHLARVEGHGNIRVKIKNGKVDEARWDVVETPRFFEVMLKGKHYTTPGILTARICGICSIGHCLASLRATEHAFGIEIPPLAKKLRLLAKHGETLQSHYLHLFFLAVPDFIGLPSALPLLTKNPGIVDIARRLKGLGNHICDIVAGRTTHPVSLQVGGVAAVPPKDKLLALQDELGRSLNDLSAVVDLFLSFDIPRFTRETEFVSLKGNDEYPWIGGKLVSTDNVEKDEHDYLSMTNEYVDKNNTSKWCRLSRDTFAVGALARLNNNFQFLHGDAVKIAEKLDLKPVNHNPFMNNVAQLVECVQVTLDAMRLIDEIVQELQGDVMVPVIPCAGEGVGAVEVPRGILYHHYVYGDNGRIQKANCIIPTTQNNANIHRDLDALAEHFSGDDMTDTKLELLCSMLVRAYDPCISCSVH